MLETNRASVSTRPDRRVDLPTFPDHRPRQARPNSEIDAEARFIDELGNPIGLRPVRHAARTSPRHYTLLFENGHEALSVKRGKCRR